MCHPPKRALHHPPRRRNIPKVTPPDVWDKMRYLDETELGQNQAATEYPQKEFMHNKDLVFTNVSTLHPPSEIIERLDSPPYKDDRRPIHKATNPKSTLANN